MSTVEENPVAEKDVHFCKDCDKEFDTAEEARDHWRAEHSARARAQKAGASQKRRRSTPAARSKAAASSAMSPVRTGLTLSYALAGQAFGMFGPEPREARQAVAMSMQMTAGPGGAALDRLAQRTPVYKYLNGFFGAAGVLEDVTPLGIPLIVGMYAYAPDPAKDALRPMAGTMLGLLLLQTFGPEPPGMPEDATPVALPPWIQDFVNGLLPRARVQTVEPEPVQGPPRPEASQAA